MCHCAAPDNYCISIDFGVSVGTEKSQLQI